MLFHTTPPRPTQQLLANKIIFWFCLAAEKKKQKTRTTPKHAAHALVPLFFVKRNQIFNSLAKLSKYWQTRNKNPAWSHTYLFSHRDIKCWTPYFSPSVVIFAKCKKEYLSTHVTAWGGRKKKRQPIRRKTIRSLLFVCRELFTIYIKRKKGEKIKKKKRSERRAVAHTLDYEKSI